MQFCGIASHWKVSLRNAFYLSDLESKTAGAEFMFVAMIQPSLPQELVFVRAPIIFGPGYVITLVISLLVLLHLTLT